MVEVTKEEFYRAIGPLNATPTPVGTYPYTNEFRLFYSRRLVGKIVPSEVDPKKYPYPWFINHYYITKGLHESSTQANNTNQLKPN